MLPDELLPWASRLLTSLLILLAFWVGSSLLSGLLRRTAARIAGHRQLLSLSAQTAAWALRILGLISALGALGVDVSAIIASLGLTGFALGFAFRDLISNLLAGLMILLYRPFIPGDRIRMNEFEGVVQSIDLRYTSIRLDDRRRALLPNSNLLTTPIIIMKDEG